MWFAMAALDAAAEQEYEARNLKLYSTAILYLKQSIAVAYIATLE